MREYKSLKNKKYKMRYHLIFSTKYRRKCLEPLRECILDSFEKFTKSHFNIRVIIAEIDKDHIHILIDIPPTVSVNDTVKGLKQYSTYYCWKNSEDYLKNFYWSGKHILWTKGYFCSTVGDISEKITYNYIKNQG